MSGKDKINLLYIDCRIVNDEPVKKTIDYNGREINIFYINHGVSSVYVLKENKIDIIFEDSHDTLAGQFAVDFLRSKLKLKGEHYKVDIDGVRHIKGDSKINENKLKFLNCLVEKIKNLCEEDEDILTINSDVLRSIPYENSPNLRT